MYVQGVLTLLDPRIDELDLLVKESQTVPSSPSLSRPVSASTTYTLMEYGCCARSLPKTYSKALDVQTMANEEVCHVELILELIMQFETDAVDCRKVLSSYEEVVTELRNGMLEGKMANQPWASARQVIS